MWEVANRKISVLYPSDKLASWSSGNTFVSGAGGLRPVESNIALPTIRHRCDISSKEAVLPGRNGVEIGPANLLRALAYYKLVR